MCFPVGLAVEHAVIVISTSSNAQYLFIIVFLSPILKGLIQKSEKANYQIFLNNQDKNERNKIFGKLESVVFVQLFDFENIKKHSYGIFQGVYSASFVIVPFNRYLLHVVT
jgi:hypothetical protein